jgi:hypothetical protein
VVFEKDGSTSRKLVVLELTKAGMRFDSLMAP